MNAISITKRKLTIIFSSLLCGIVFVLLGILWNILRLQIISNTEQLRLTQYSVIQSQIGDDMILRDSWLAEQEQKSSCLIFIMDGEHLINFQGAYIPKTNRETLFNLIQTSDSTDSVFKITGIDGDDYSVYKSTQSDIRIWVAFDNAIMHNQLTHFTAIYLLIYFFTAICLILLCIILIKIATKPAVIAIEQQNQFVAAASHELRSPITVIKANLSALNECHLSDQASTLVETTEQEADRLRNLAESLLSLANSDMSKLKIEPTSIQLDEYLLNVYESLLPLVTTSGYRLRVILPETDLPTITCDKQHLTQVISILVQNAISYSQSIEPFILQLHQSDNRIFLSVIDHGVGIPDSEKDKIFQRFYQVDQSRSSKDHYGLGLSIASSLASANHFDLMISDTPGGGATFSICFDKACVNPADNKCYNKIFRL